MTTDRRHLNFDFAFLDLPPPPPDASESNQRRRGFLPNYDWSKIRPFGVVAFLVLLWIISSQNSSHRSSDASQSYQSNPPPGYSLTDTNSSTSVSNGQYRCSQYDSGQADAMEPTNGPELDAETDALSRRDSELSLLKSQIAGSGVSQNPDQVSIDRYNSLVDRYNAELGTLKADWAAHQNRVDAYNQAVQDRNTYLMTHCSASN